MKTIPEMLKSLTRGTEGITGIQETVAPDNFAETKIILTNPNPADEAMFLKIRSQADALRAKLLKLGIDANSITSNVINAEVSVDIDQTLYGQVREAYTKHLAHSVTTLPGLASMAGHGIQEGAHFLSQKARHLAEKFHERRNPDKRSGREDI